MRTTLVGCSVLDGKGRSSTRCHHPGRGRADRRHRQRARVPVRCQGARYGRPGGHARADRLPYPFRPMVARPAWAPGHPFVLPVRSDVQGDERCTSRRVYVGRDPGGLDAGFRDAVNDGLAPGPRLQTSITIISPINGICDGSKSQGGTVPYMPGMPSPECTGPVESAR